MKKIKLTYWISTGLFSALMLMSAYTYFTAPEMSANFKLMGFSDNFRIELGVAKLLGAFALLLPFIPKILKEWAYAGFAITLISAIIVHTTSGHPLGMVMAPVIVFIPLIFSRIMWGKMAN